MRLAKAIARGVFSAWVWGSGFAWMFFGSCVTLVLRGVGFPYQKVHVWVTGRVFGSVPWFATIKLRIHHHPDYEPEERSVYCQNHINLLDGMVASATIPHAFSGLMHSWQFWIPIYGWLMLFAKGIGIRKGRREKIIDDLSAEARIRKEIGMSVLTFPEGTRTRTGVPGRFKRGVFLMARNAGMPVVPLAVRGLYEANNKTTGWLFSPWKTVDVFVGPQFSTEGLDNDGVHKLADRVRTFIVECLETGEFPKERPARTSAA